MSFGFRSINDSNIIQIDSDYSNYVLFQQTNVTFLANTNPVTVTYSTQSEPPLIVFSNIPNGYGIGLTNIATNTSFQVNRYFSSDPASTTAQTTSAAITCTCKLYKRASAASPSSDTHGMRVFKSDGTLAFDSGLSYLQVAQYAVASTTYPVNIAGQSNPGVVINGTYNIVGGVFNGFFTVILAWCPVVYTTGVVSIKRRPVSELAVAATFVTNDWSTLLTTY